MSAAEVVLLAIAVLCLLALLLMLALWGGPPVCPHCGAPHRDYSIECRGGYQSCPFHGAVGGTQRFP